MRDTFTLLPHQKDILARLGENIKLARLRRNLSMKTVCDRADISRSTLWQIEKGSPSVSMGAYIMVLHALNGADKELLKILEDDPLGRTIQDFGLITPKKGNK